MFFKHVLVFLNRLNPLPLGVSFGEDKGRLTMLDNAKEAVENIAKKINISKTTKLIPKSVFDCFSNQSQIMYKTITGNYSGFSH